MPIPDRRLTRQFMGKIFVSSQVFRNTFTATIAVFCSDERFSQAAFECLKTTLGVERCDLIVYPGGPQFIASNQEDPIKRMKFLIQAHSVTRIILLSHTQCGYYMNLHPEMTESVLSALQISDIHKAADDLRRMFPGITVECYYMGLEGEHLFCSPVV